MAVISTSELAKYNTREALWVGVHGQVYDLTKFATHHPGGVEVLEDCAGTDATEVFAYAGHGENHIRKIHEYAVGFQNREATHGSSWQTTQPAAPAAPSANTRFVLTLRTGMSATVIIMTISAIAVIGVWSLTSTRPRRTDSATMMVTDLTFLLSMLGGGSGMTMAVLFVLYLKIRDTWTHSVEVFHYPAVIPAQRIK